MGIIKIKCNEFVCYFSALFFRERSGKD